MATKAKTAPEHVEKSVGVAVIADLLDCSEDSVHRYVKTRGLPCIQICNRSRRFLVSEVLVWRDRKRTTFAAIDDDATPAPPVKRRPGRPAARESGAWGDEIKEIGKGKK